ncbi:MAG: PilX N-terminal domain-containing pilus assembly protein [Gammaproteobacteria bacterium]|nr:PilX N-terminal domain-containing pilus assembly protein [Gammaproteobacteria bacterium]
MNTSLPRRQQGAALIVGLILLMILTLLGVTGLNTATLEVAMADNMQRGQYAFQGAESAIMSEMRIAPGAVTLNGSETRGQVLRATIPYPYDDAAGNRVVDVMVGTSFQGYVEFGEASSQVHFESRGVANTPVRGAQSIQRAGYFVLAPNPDGS